MAVSAADEAMRRLVHAHSGTATAEDQAAIAAWRAAAPAREEAFREAEELWDAASGLARDESTGLAHVPGSGDHAARGVARPGSRRARGRSLAVAATILLPLSFVLWLSSSPGRVALAHCLADYSARTGEVRTLTLEDGSSVTLGARSSIDVHFDSGGTAR